MDRRRFLAGSGGALGLSLVAPRTAHAAPKPRLVDPRFSQFGQGGDPDHGVWDALLSKGVKMGRDGVARFDYARVDRNALNGYLTNLQAVDPRTLSSGAAFAYWVNLYNTLTVAVVAEAYPVSSIRRIGGSVLQPGPWRAKRVEVTSVALSLDDIEHGILRPVWRDPRIHYAVNCASIGCPNLAPTAYRAGQLERMLTTGARAYVNHPRGVTVTGQGAVVSSIYHWFKVDFGGQDAGVLEHLRAFAADDQATRLGPVRRIVDHRYDWALNDI
ncbi:MAG: DUF547 domain-containing protein [Pseudomonadota bacterium]